MKFNENLMKFDLARYWLHRRESNFFLHRGRELVEFSPPVTKNAAINRKYGFEKISKVLKNEENAVLRGFFLGVFTEIFGFFRD